MKYYKILETIGFVLFGAFILSWVMWYNGYPLVYSDSGTYIDSAHTLIVPHDRPKVYGEFIRITGSTWSLWMPILIQNLILAIAMFDFYRIVSVSKSKSTYLIIVLFLAGFTGVSWYSAQVMPDIFTSILWLCTMNIFLRKSESVFVDVFNALAIILSISFHNSHVALALLLTAVFLVVLILNYKSRFLKDIQGGNKKIGVILAIYVMGLLTAPIIHYSYEDKFIYSKSSHIVLLSKFAENGTLKSYLKERCTEAKFKSEHEGFCSCYENINTSITDFLYAPNSPVNLNSGWGEQSKEEYNFFIKDILKNRKYFWLNVTSSIQNTISQLFRTEIGSGLVHYLENSSPHYVIHVYYPDEAMSYDTSRQNVFGFELEFLNDIHMVLMALCVLFVFSYKKLKSFLTIEEKIALIASIIVIVLNSVATGGLHVCYERFQTRIIWVLPFVVVMILINRWRELRKIF